MNRVILALAMVSVAWSSPAFCQDDLDIPPPALFHAPSLATSVYFPPALTNAVVADAGHAFGMVSRNSARPLPCTSTNPCAIATPAADFVPPPR